jgi:asparagine synthase (glutamine-hydrolysing)
MGRRVRRPLRPTSAAVAAGASSKMCGISGILNLKDQPVDPGQVESMSDRISHRGPDDAGLWHCEQVALGHRRLSIIDLSARGHNPMSNEDGTVWITFNGEIYNYRSLRKALSERHTFSSETDTEVIIHLYEERGVDCLQSLNGMFAFALWDCFQRRLLLARDRCGIKPLYYVILGDILAFASEIKAFLALPSFRVRPHLPALAEHFTFQNTFEDRTMFEGVKMLPAGHYLVAHEGRISTCQYWDLQFEPDPRIRPDVWAAGLRERFEAAVDLQLRSDVPVGTFLSGGMDTGSICAVASRRLPGMHSFTCGFALPTELSELEQYFDERPEARGLAEDFKTSHHELELDSRTLQMVMPLVVWHLDEPRVGISYQIYSICELIRRYVTVVLSGVGGDELFGGYGWRYGPVLDLNGAAFDEEYYRLSTRLLDDEARRRFFTPEVASELADFSCLESVHGVLRGCRGVDPLHRALYFDFKTFLAGLLFVDDKLSMAHSIEERVPFLDNELVDYIRHIPAELKVTPQETKLVLKQAMRGLIPDQTLRRRKQGFTPPDRTWYRAQNLTYIRDLILGPRAQERGYFQPRFLEAMLDDHVRGSRDNRFLIWSLMCFEWWNRLFVDREPLPGQV